MDPGDKDVMSKIPWSKGLPGRKPLFLTAAFMSAFVLLLGLFSPRALAWPPVFPPSRPVTKISPPQKIRLGVLPVADTILLHLAVRQNYFAQRNWEVELINFQSRLEKDAAVIAGQLEGHFCEISSAMLQRAQGYPYTVVATTSHTEPDSRVFGLVTKPGSQAKTIGDLKNQTLGIAGQTIVDYLTDIFLLKENLPLDFFQRRDIRKIPIRQQMLRAGRIEAALFPEPLLSMAEKNGGTVVLDDRALDMPLAAVALRDDLITQPVVTEFRKAISEAVAYANLNPVYTRNLMAELGLIPASLADWTPPLYNPVHVPGRLPDRALFDSYVAWLRRGGVLKARGESGNLREASAFEETIYQLPDLP
ncbi:MAG: ABC transporter substrate-binding protein [Deltaproteobacteria bacterium]|jgi:NitT/TauT family transport system substrate-binding protein|nr:ABC transporter substrate-binding protein [Deltaproteobacteria bacterium]